ncbi:MAG: hypothetical protein ABSF34_13120, partial [Verrucomicrobiota bacterium]
MNCNPDLQRVVIRNSRQTGVYQIKNAEGFDFGVCFLLKKKLPAEMRESLVRLRHLMDFIALAVTGLAAGDGNGSYRRHGRRDVPWPVPDSRYFHCCREAVRGEGSCRRLDTLAGSARRASMNATSLKQTPTRLLIPIALILLLVTGCTVGP